MSLKICVDTEGLDVPGLHALARLDSVRLMNALGAEGVTQTQYRIKHEKTAPDGQAWKPLNTDYAMNKRGGGLLEKNGDLIGSITHQIHGPDEVAFGSNLIYAAVHQKGGRITPKNKKALVFKFGNHTVVAGAVTIPARPYLGLSQKNQTQMEIIAVEHMRSTFHAA